MWPDRRPGRGSGVSPLKRAGGAGVEHLPDPSILERGCRTSAEPADELGTERGLEVAVRIDWASRSPPARPFVDPARQTAIKDEHGVVAHDTERPP